MTDVPNQAARQRAVRLPVAASELRKLATTLTSVQRLVRRSVRASLNNPVAAKSIHANQRKAMVGQALEGEYAPAIVGRYEALASVLRRNDR